MSDRGRRRKDDRRHQPSEHRPQSNRERTTSQDHTPHHSQRGRGRARGRGHYPAGGRHNPARDPNAASGRVHSPASDRPYSSRDSVSSGGVSATATGTSYWTFEAIKQISNASSQDIVDRVQHEQNAFLRAFEFDGNLKRTHVLQSLIKILVGLSNSPAGLTAFASRMISQVFENCAAFVMKLSEYIQTSTSSHQLLPLINIGRFCIDNVPQSTMFTFPQSQLRDAINSLPDSATLQQVFSTYDKRFQEVRAEFLKQRQIKKEINATQISEENSHDLPPPNNFREIEILPNPEEIKDVHCKPFLRPNITRGAYHNWDHYLDVHFRLLREDFMGPLREGIHNYLQGIQGNTKVQLYTGVQILAPVCIYTGIGFLIQFDTRLLSRVRWEHSRRLIYGSLLCLSCDHFRTVCFASVVGRDVKSLQHGQLVIKFEGDINAFKIDPSTKYEMVESPAYFEAYRHVLDGLQAIIPDQMPFHPYLVDGHCPGAEIPLPLYLRQRPFLDLNSVLQPKRAIRQVDVTKLPNLMDANTCLDESQLKALQMALSQEISVIQGPPGTGKTYIGLKIVEALLQNRLVWDPHSNCPILVVCYTNHALDQFLEGVLDCRIGHEKPNVVRVGGRCKNEKINDCVLANLVSKMKSDHLVPFQVYRRIKASRSAMKQLREGIEASLKAIDAKEGKLLTVEELHVGGVMNYDHYQQLAVGIEVPREKIIEYWLGLWFAPSQEPAMDEDAQLTAALKESLQMASEKEGLQPTGIAQAEEEEEGGLIIEGDDDDEFIEVLDEPQLLEEDRILQGENMEMPLYFRNEEQPKEKKVKEVTKTEDGWQVVQLDPNKRKQHIKKGMSYTPLNDKQAKEIHDVWDLNIKKRWQLYRHWLNGFIRVSKAALKHSADSYDRCAQVCQETDREVNLQALKKANVVGVTTTGAAKHSYIFRQINPKIVIVEEAAEVLESHIVTSLCSSVQQLILIGDHKQLQPKITHYELEKHYNLHISLFERLISNQVPIATLAVQHRMRPEIASIVGNHIYDHLENHESVLKYENVKGVGKNLFFVDHSSPEKDNPTGDVRSHANTFEACYVVALTRYLLKQGYNRSQITILTMYRGQLFEIRQKMRKDEFDGVRVAAVDDFQGEENDIIILSLVRSNNEGRIGFLKVENRVCVSLSRAREGMFVIGNLAMLRRNDTTKWPAILGQLDKEGCIGNGLPLYCQSHPNERLTARMAEDFSKCPEGGCQKPCGFRLECGHVCRSPCHPVDREHKLIYKCQQKCSKKLPCGHECTRKCFECQEGCPPCQVNVERRLSGCGHKARMWCSSDPAKVDCRKQCDRIIGCGHRCQNKCSQPCTPVNKCIVEVYKVLACGHTVPVLCSVNKDGYQCIVPCNKDLTCGHKCIGTCGKCHQGRLHVACAKRCGRTLACGHLCSFPCTSNCPPCTQKCSNYCYHSKCPKLCYEPCSPCREPCQWICKHHRCTAKCGEMCNRPRCDVPCNKPLTCGHPCIGLCGEECPSLCGVCNKEEVQEIFFGTEEDEGARFIQLKDCLHVFEVTGLDNWMDQANANLKESHVVKFIECPRCKTPIRRSLRYGNIIKATISDVEEVKCRVLDGSNVDVFKLSQNSLQVAHDVRRWKELHDVAQFIHDHIQQAIDSAARGVPPLLPHQVNTIDNQLILIPHVAKVFNHLDALPGVSLFQGNVDRSMLLDQVRGLARFLNTTYLTPQQMSDAKLEIQRQLSLVQLFQLQAAIITNRKQLQPHDQQELTEKATLLLECGKGISLQLNDEQHTEISQFMEKLRKEYGILGVTKEEMAIIVKAMDDVQKGAWYKCPNGHIYAIGECGGATVVGKCLECGAAVGGQNHRLLSDNIHAGEVDNSSHAAWSEAANLGNYDPQALQEMFPNW